MSIQIRCDDYPGTKPDEFYRHNRASFEEFDGVMQETLGKKYLLGVIPLHTPDVELSWLAARNLVIGMHGVTHDERFQNEFGDRFTTNEVVARLDNSRKRLQHLTRQPIDVYLPPHNVIDIKTINALLVVGFKAFTAGPGSMFERSFHSDRMLSCFHSSAPLEYGRSDELLARGAASWLITQAQTKTVYLTLHFPWEVNLHNDFSTLREFLVRIKDHVFDFVI